ncbi:hypothetical protein SS1G_01503 [Sclerotinia sclerotiorum 1980 UF-70]|uniref:Uncharacterized protein n=1 Tax=Sclerotinia sclerotiorum (strain ATCC 18683 / 1980 / Ss-1) TaxID=665079 RepID=A7E875_SCLS1|nr:hypothetical protein SS1G_01503 [Sclerotinia sclerotiorum 1980 UF-70]EDN96577.1 hypothetical protein SS1G_01503 [Sclerotinia sclerotiorum 1980 UF-70]
MSFGFGIGDILAVIELAKNLRKDFINAPRQFQDISTDKILNDIKTNAGQFYERQDIRELNIESSKIIDWLTPINYAPQQQDYINQRQPGTGEWLLDSPEFRQWVESDVQRLFCPGIPGAGKTMLTSIVVEELTNRFGNDKSVGIAYFLSLLAIPKFSSLWMRLMNIQWPMAAERGFYRNFSIIEKHTKLALSWLQDMFLKLETSLMTLMLEIRASDQDVKRYLDGHISQLPGYVLRNSELQDGIKSHIIKAVDGMFLLARLHLQSLRGKKSPKAIQQALKSLPTGSNAYDYAYKDAMERIGGQLEDERELAKQVLSWITCARRPLTTTELQEALAVEIYEPELDKENFSEINAMISVCAGLVIVDDESDVVRLVHYTTQEYFERTQGDWFPDAEDYITTTCITYLSFDSLENCFCEMDRGIMGRINWRFMDQVQSYELFSYAADNWRHHARKASLSDQTSTLYQSIVRFLESEAKVNASWQGLSAVLDHWVEWDPPVEITAMHLVAYFGIDTTVKFLLDMGEVDPDANHEPENDNSNADEHEDDIWHTDRKGALARTPLSYAAENGHTMVVKLLLDTDKVDINSGIHERRPTPLSYAIIERHEAVVKLLLDTGKVEIDQYNSVDGQTPLSYAAKHGYESIVKLLLDTGKLTVDCHDILDKTPFSYAAENGHESIVRLLFNTGKVSVDLQDFFNLQAPLLYAAEYGHEAIVKFLLETVKAQIDLPDRDGQTLL